jgi:hypothetical protein
MLAQLQIQIVPPIVFVPTKCKYGNTVVITTASFSNKQVCCLLRCLPEVKLLRTPDENSLNQNSPTPTTGVKPTGLLIRIPYVLRSQLGPEISYPTDFCCGFR